MPFGWQRRSLFSEALTLVAEFSVNPLPWPVLHPLPEFSLILQASDILNRFPSFGLAALWPEAGFRAPPPLPSVHSLCSFPVTVQTPHVDAESGWSGPIYPFSRAPNFSSRNGSQADWIGKSVFSLSIHITSNGKMTGHFRQQRKA